MAEDARKTLTDRVGELMAAEGGFLIKQDEWGIRKLAYEIRKKPRGFYTLLDFCGQGALVDEMERQFRIDDRVLKYMTIVLDKEADLESIKAEIAAAQSEAETAAAEGETQAQTAAESPAAESPVAESPATDASGEKATQVEKAAANADAEPTAKEGVKAQTAETESVEKE
jgi:small subunit ribosomal protein S6